MPPKISKGIEIHTTITCDNHVIIIVLHSQCHIFSILQNTSTHTPTPAPTDQNDSATAHIPTPYTDPFTTNRAETFYPTAVSPLIPDHVRTKPKAKLANPLSDNLCIDPSCTNHNDICLSNHTHCCINRNTSTSTSYIAYKVTMTTAAIWIEPSADYRVSITPKHRDSHILVIYNFGWNGHGIQSNTIVLWSAARSINEGSFSRSQITSSGIVSDSRHRN
eukprot:96622_1